MMVYDVEILRAPEQVEGGWENPQGMGFGTAVVYDSKSDLYLFYGPGDDQKEQLIKKLTGQLVVTFNGIKFDNAVLLGNDYGQSPWDDYDILKEIICAKWNAISVKEAEQKYGAKEIYDGSMGLDAIAVSTLNRTGKTGHGSQAPWLIQNGKWAECFAYNLNDVRLTRFLANFINRYGYIVDGFHTMVQLDKRPKDIAGKG
jgi:hypothetical protein